MRNTKKILLLALLATVVSTKAFAGFGAGVKFFVDVNEGTDWGLGATLGMGNMTGRPVILDVLFGFGGNMLTIKPTLDWHILPWNIGIIQLYLGLGIGTAFTFSTVESSTDPFSFVLAGRVPLGIKVFITAIELFFEVTPQFGWINTSWNNNNVVGDKSRSAVNDFYWAIGFSTGLRIWF